MTVGENIRRIRQERNLTQRQLGEMVGASEAYIRAYESGRRNPKPSSLEKIAEKPSTDFFRYSGNTMDSSLNTRIKMEMIWLESALVHYL